MEMAKWRKGAADGQNRIEWNGMECDHTVVNAKYDMRNGEFNIGKDSIEMINKLWFPCWL